MNEVQLNDLIEVSPEEFKSRINAQDSYVAEMQEISDTLDEGQICFNYINGNNNYLGSIILEETEARHLVLSNED